MAQFLKPSNLNNVWASGGDRIYPGDNKYATGWQVEIPPRQYFNEIDYKQDQMLAHLNQHGIPVWDNMTEYQAGKSYIQGSNGTIYRCVLTHGGSSSSAQDPVLDISGTHWEVPFLTSDQVPIKSTTAQAQARVDDTTFITPLKLAQAFGGSNINENANGSLRLPGGLMLQWGTVVVNSAEATYSFPTAFSSSVFVVVGSDGNSSQAAYTAWQPVAGSLTQFRAIASGNNITSSYIAIGI